ARPVIFAAPLPGGDPYRGIRTSLFAFFGQDDWKVRKNLTLNLGLRYEIVTSPTEANDKLVNLRNFATDTQLTVGYPFFKPSRNTLAPRLGFAWDIFGDGKTSVRGGYGIFFAQPFPNLYRFAMSTNPPFFTVGLAFSPPFPNAFNRLANLPGFVGISTHEFEPAAAYVQQWNLGLQKEIFGGITASVAYVGSRGVHLPTNANRNQSANFTILPNGEKQFPVGVRNPPRNPAFGQSRILQYDANSYYNAMQLNLERRFAQGLQFHMAYTFSKSIDTASDAVGNFQQAAHDLPQDPYNPRGERGLSVFDRRHVFNLSTIYQLPYKTRPGAEGARRVTDFLLGGWQLNNIITAHSGSPFHPIITFNNSNDGSTDNVERPDWAPGFSPENTVTGDPNR
ncbi:MAG: TonB-dependent receptor domain-containing protein, partial [Pyrinomonadaceae bacterium]